MPPHQTVILTLFLILAIPISTTSSPLSANVPFPHIKHRKLSSKQSWFTAPPTPPLMPESPRTTPPGFPNSAGNGLDSDVAESSNGVGKRHLRVLRRHSSAYTAWVKLCVRVLCCEHEHGYGVSADIDPNKTPRTLKNPQAHEYLLHLSPPPCSPLLPSTSVGPAAPRPPLVSPLSSSTPGGVTGVGVGAVNQLGARKFNMSIPLLGGGAKASTPVSFGEKEREREKKGPDGTKGNEASSTKAMADGRDGGTVLVVGHFGLD
ncbi:LOW QUALITY PROTEIN: hypothetical protein CVT26_004359 [Gymnopilus dilepis]|uniref:Uncharacterized protein n=1 Tax=Gymnopilus dilepis TaxID=231916 RepID=A0A409W6Y2_9AGAR|nr:LOW QUALITY PROTEIN: hypothetical protein CVT26_004359 [Gymnopilus dilepis]